MIAHARRWAAQRTLLEWVVLGTGILTFAYLGWDGALWDARLQLLLHLAAVAVITGMGLHGLRGGELPRTSVDVPILLLLGAYALATLLAVNAGMSLRAMGAIVALTLMLPAALLALRFRPTWAALVVCLPTLALAAGTLVAMASRRVAWVLADAPGLPPLRLAAEGTPFGSVAVAPFVLLATWAIAGQIEDGRWRRGFRISLVVVGIPLVILSGSRSAWVAYGVAALVLAVPWMLARRDLVRRARRPGPRMVLAAAGALVVVAALAAIMAPRLTAITSVIYRGDLWRDTITAWLARPLTGLGPGIMPYARQAAAPDGTFPVSQPHSHNWALGVLGDAGVIGLIAGIVLVAAFAWVAGPWRSRGGEGRIASAVLLGIAVSALFEDITFLPNFSLLIILLAAIALTDAGAVRWTRLPRLPAAAVVAAIGGTAALLVGMVIADAGGIAYRAGADAANDGDWPSAARWFQRSVAIDAWHPLGPDALAVALSATGDDRGARDAAARATQLNPGNGRAWANLAVACGRLGDADCEVAAARRAVAKARLQDPTLFLAADALERAGYPEEADDAYRRSLLTNPLTSFATDWPRPLGIGDGRIDDASALAAGDLNLLLARHATGEEVMPDDYDTASVRALAHAMRGEVDAAREALADARREAPDAALTWEIDLVLRRAFGEPLDEAERIYTALLGMPIVDPDHPIEIPGVRYDIGSFRMIPRDGFLPGAEDLRVFPLYPWILGTLLSGGSAGG
ncbi:MAG TPA: O-antigen ligase family protein [Candidatus Limnocylindria bacterium]|nr:O-antigen ligase family protein [Candidatus Limnocylindria bacterium]